MQKVEVKNDWQVPWKIVTKKKNKIADRFAESKNILIQSLKDNAKNKNTQQLKVQTTG